MGATYPRPIEAKLVVKLANGETWEATAKDLANFGYVDRLDAYMAFNRHVARVLQVAGLQPDGNLTETAINPLRFLVELALCHPDLLDHPETAETDAEVVEIERTLRAAVESAR